MRRFAYIAAAGLAAILSAGLFQRSVGASQASLEYEVKAAFLYNFAKFVEWPDTAFDAADAPIVFCVMGNNPFDGRLERVVSDRTANGRRIEVRSVTSSGASSGCHLAFFDESQQVDVARIVQISAGRGPGAPVLTVGESEHFAEVGGMIRLLVEEGRVRFDINAAIAERAGLKLSSQLLKLARRVEK
jgi:hypothetical protein